jgi:serine/threonine protein phosphatase PrpC
MGFGLILVAIYATIGLGRIDQYSSEVLSLSESSNDKIGSPLLVPAWKAEGSAIPFTGSSRCRGRDDCIILLPAILPFPTHLRLTARDEANKNGFVSSKSSLCTLMGQKGGDSQNQDRILLIETPTGFLAALFDGHGFHGEDASDAASRLLPSAILDALEDDEMPFSDFIRDLFLGVDAEVLRGGGGGTTAFVMLLDGDTVHLAWVGDSKAFLVRWLDDDEPSSTRVDEEAINNYNQKQDDTAMLYDKLLDAPPHKPADPDERHRIEANGGRIFVPNHPLETSRVFYRDIDEFGQVVEQGLAMSRSLGDKGGKNSNVVIAEPSFRSITLPSNSGEKYFVVLATDGVTDVIPEQVLLTRIGKALYPSASLRRRDNLLAKLCHGIISDAADGWTDTTGGTYRDDISLVFRRIEQRGR